MSSNLRRLHAALGWTAVLLAASLGISKWLVNLSFPVAAALYAALCVTEPRILRDGLRNPVVGWAAALFALYLISIAWSPAPVDRSLAQLSSYRVLLFALVFLPVLVDERWRMRVLVALLAGLGLTLALSLIQSVVALPFAKATREGVGTTDAYIWSDRIRQNIQMTVLYLWALGMLLFERQHRDRRLLVALLTVATAVDILLLVQSRTGYATVGAVTLVLCRERFGWRGLLAGAAGLVLLVAAVVLVLPGLAARLAATGDEVRQYLANGTATAVGIRLDMWGHALRMIAAAPLFGHGIESFEALARQASTVMAAAGAGTYHDPHNEFLYVGVELGLVGLAAWLAGLVALWRIAGRFDDRWRWLARGAIGLYVGAGLLNGIVNIGGTGYLFGMLLALVAGRDAQRRAGAAAARLRPATAH